MQITLQQLQGMCLRASAAGLAPYVGPINATLAKFKIDTPTRAAFFLANLLVETGEFSTMRENMDYTADRMKAVWGARFFPDNLDKQLEHKPVELANYIYADLTRPPGFRMGNDKPGDGWKYRGWGALQTTGKSETQAYLKRHGLPLDTDPDQLLKPDIALDAAGDEWDAKGLNAVADTGDFQAVVQSINGGLTGFDDRKVYLHGCLAALA
jgi:putative chitinase